MSKAKSRSPSKPKLKPCPFCGSGNIIIQEISHQPYGEGQNYFVICEKCFATEGSSGANEDESNAVKAWNRRVK